MAFDSHSVCEPSCLIWNADTLNMQGLIDSQKKEYIVLKHCGILMYLISLITLSGKYWTCDPVQLSQPVAL